MHGDETYAVEQPVGQRRNQRRNQTMSWDKWKWKQNIAKFTDAAKAVQKEGSL